MSREPLECRSRRTFLLGALGVTAAGLLAACGQATPPTSPPAAPTSPPAAPTSPPAAAPTAAPVAPTVAPAVVATQGTQPAQTPAPSAATITRQNTLIISTPEDVVSLDPPVGGSDLSSEIDWQVYEMPINGVYVKQGEVLVQQGNQTEPWMAEKVDSSADGLTITFHMRQGVKFYPSGNEMTAKDMDWGIRRMLEMPVGYGKSVMANCSISKPGRIVDTYTFEATLDKANIAALSVIAGVDNAILDSTEAKKHATDADPWANEYLTRNILGTGPYYVTSIKPGQEVVLEVVPNYWRQPPFFKRIVYRTVPDPSVRLTLLQSGDVDIAYKLTGEEFKSLEGAKNIVVREAFEPRLHTMFMNTLTGPTADINVRKAIAYATPYNDILSVALFGAGRPWDSQFMPEALGYIKGPDYSTDIAKAKEFLAQSQSPNGFGVTVAFDSAVPQHEQAALLLQAALKPLNIDVTIAKMPTAQFRTDGSAHKLQLAIYALVTWWQEGTAMIPSRMLPDGITNWSGVRIQEIADILPTLYTTDTAVRKAGYERVQQLWNEQVPQVYFGLSNQQIAMAQNIQNYVFTVTTVPQYYFTSRT
jgi:peptide/nickel transport system substrate-binding protein